MITVKCYGGLAHGRTIDSDGLTSHRFEMIVEPQFSPRIKLFPHLIPVPHNPIDTCTYCLQTYRQQGTTECRSKVFRQVRVAVLEGAGLTVRERHELEDAMERVPWLWRQAPSILHQFEAWWEKALHDQGWERVRVHY